MLQVQTISREVVLTMNGIDPSETTRRAPRLARAYLQGALHDGTFNIRRKTHRFSQKDVEWLHVLQAILQSLDHRSWLYREGKSRNVSILETSAKFLDINFDPTTLSDPSTKVAYIRGFFDAEGGVPKDPKARFYIQFVQKNQPKLSWIRKELIAMRIDCGKLHIPSVQVDPDYFRFFVSTKAHSVFARQISSWHPRKAQILARMMI